MPIRNRLAEWQPEIAGWRRELHQMPELLFETEKTARFVEEKLKAFGLDEIHYGMAKNAVVGVIKGKSDTKGRVIGLRADMDALPIKEKTGLSYASKNDGLMHACGHDGHTAMLLGAARYLAETRNFDGKVVVIFQPAEEGGAGGDVMVKEGLMEKYAIQEVYGMHNIPGISVGEFAIRPGGIMAAADQFDITVTGKGTHASRPEDGVDSTLVAANLIVELNQIVARNVPALESAVVSVCGVKTDTYAHNVLPGNVELAGTVRTFNPDIQSLIHDRIRQVVEHVAAAHGASARLNLTRGYPPTVNHEEMTRFAGDAAEAVAGSVNRDTEPLMGGEDFSFMANARPGAYILLGNGETAMVHHPEYDFNDEAIPAGCSYWAEIAEQRLAG